MNEQEEIEISFIEEKRIFTEKKESLGLGTVMLSSFSHENSIISAEGKFDQSINTALERR